MSFNVFILLQLSKDKSLPGEAKSLSESVGDVSLSDWVGDVKGDRTSGGDIMPRLFSFFRFRGDRILAGESEQMFSFLDAFLKSGDIRCTFSVAFTFEIMLVSGDGPSSCLALVLLLLLSDMFVE